MKGSDYIMPQTTQKVKLALNLGIQSHRIAAAILYGDRQKAEEILRIVGYDSYIPGTKWSTLGDVAEFYGVTQPYIRGIASRCKISSKTMQENVLLKMPGQFCASQGIQCSGYTAYLPGNREYTFHCHKRMVFYDARVVLAFAPLAFMGRKIIPGSNAERVLNLIKRTNFMEESRKYDPEYQEPKETALAPEFAPAGFHPGNTVMTENGNIYVPVSAMTEIIKAIIPYLAKGN